MYWLNSACLYRLSQIDKTTTQRNSDRTRCSNHKSAPRDLWSSVYTLRCFRFYVTSLALLSLLITPVAAQRDTPLSLAAAIEKTLVDAISRTERSIVAIARVRKDRFANLDERTGPLRQFPLGLTARPTPTDPEFVPNEYATGIVVDQAGLILTNYHVLGPPTRDPSVETLNEFYVTTSDRKVFKVERIKAADPWSDLAVLEINTDNLTTVGWGDTNQLKKGQFVISLGNPYAIARDGQASAAWGIISNFSRKVEPRQTTSSTLNNGQIHHYGSLIQTDTKLSLGTSGGALMNLKGEVIGLTTALAATAGYEMAAGFAIPADASFQRIVETLKKGQEVEYGFLGVAPLNLSQSELLDGKHGVLVGEVISATPADTADIRRNDLITHINNQPIYDTDGLILQVGRLSVDQSVELTVLRGSQKIYKEVRLTKKSVSTLRQPIVTKYSSAWRGIRVDYVTSIPNFKTVYDGIDAADCIAIIEVAPDSSAAEAGLRSGMLLTHVENVRVRTPSEFFQATSKHDGAANLKFLEPSGERAELVVQP